MDPSKQYGKINEQIECENSARRKYSQKWGELARKDLNKFYNQNAVNEEISQSGFIEQCPYRYTGHGDSYFLSPDMFDSLVATCRCGRPKSKVHIIKCLQKVKNKYLDKSESVQTRLAKDSSEHVDYNRSGVEAGSSSGAYLIRKVPETSCGMIGWMPNRFSLWEQATHYVSPKSTMPGYKIDDHPYSNIFIG